MLLALTLCDLVLAVFTLASLCVIDLKHSLLPNKLVAAFAALGLIFHALTHFQLAAPIDLALGVLTGGGVLFAIRAGANYLAKDDTLGLGDVKLLAAAGLWLGPAHVLAAMTVGALFGIFHGLGYSVYKKIRTGHFENLKTLSIPAGPGFILGIIIVAIYKFGTENPWAH